MFSRSVLDILDGAIRLLAPYISMSTCTSRHSYSVLLLASRRSVARDASLIHGSLIGSLSFSATGPSDERLLVGRDEEVDECVHVRYVVDRITGGSSLAGAGDVGNASEIVREDGAVRFRELAKPRTRGSCGSRRSPATARTPTPTDDEARAEAMVTRCERGRRAGRRAAPSQRSCRGKRHGVSTRRSQPASMTTRSCVV